MSDRILGVIFDLDGVIVSTDNCHYLAWKRMADEEGIYFDPVSYTHLDVYKRQVIVQAINRLTGDDFVSNKEALNAALAQGLKTINAVSYTHLPAEPAPERSPHPASGRHSGIPIFRPLHRSPPCAQRGIFLFGQSQRCLLYTSRCV